MFFILFMMRTSVIISILPVLTSADAYQDAWLSSILTFFGSAIIIAVIVGVGVLYPNMTSVQYGEKLLGKWPGRLLNLIFLFAFLHIAAIEARIYAEVLVTDFLIQTPIAFVIASMVIAAVFAVHAGIKVIGRVADVIFPIFIIMVLAGLLVPIPKVGIGISNLEPVMARGWGPVLRGAVVPVAIAIRYLVLTILLPVVNKPQKVMQTVLGSLVLSTATLILAVFAVLIILGPDKGSRSMFPFFLMVRAVQVSEFLERTEVLTIFAWGFGTFVVVATFLYCGAKGLSQVLGLKDHRTLIGPMAIIWVVFSLHTFEDTFQMRSFYQPAIIGPYGINMLFALPMSILWLASIIRKRKGGT